MDAGIETNMRSAAMGSPVDPSKVIHELVPITDLSYVE